MVPNHVKVFIMLGTMDFHPTFQWKLSSFHFSLLTLYDLF